MLYISVMADVKLLNLDRKFSPASGASSLIDHFFISDSLYHLVQMVDIMDSGFNF